jgi:hypothetical protein
VKGFCRFSKFYLNIMRRSNIIIFDELDSVFDVHASVPIYTFVRHRIFLPVVEYLRAAKVYRDHRGKCCVC